MTAEQVQHFREHGFVAMPTFFDTRETAAIRAEVERLQREGYLRNVATEGGGRRRRGPSTTCSSARCIDRARSFAPCRFLAAVSLAVALAQTRAVTQT
jgi:hypothetical protein